jgi:DNA polymerase I-like protein with 3'-5' exonuclease and polymerase domains
VLVIDTWALQQDEIDALRDFLATPRTYWAHNASFDLGHLKVNGFPLGGAARCSMLASQLLQNGSATAKHGLMELSFRYLNVKLDKTQQKSEWWQPQLDSAQLEYAKEDVRSLARLVPLLESAIDRADLTIAFHLECGALAAMADMWTNGLPFSTEALKELIEHQQALKEQAEDAFRADLLERFPDWELALNLNMASPKQLAVVFTQVLGFPPTDDEGKTSVAYKVLTQYKINSPAIRFYLDWKKAEKALQLAVNLLAKVGPDGFIHCSYRQLGCQTGRMSASAPNLMQVPRSKAFRDAARAPEGWLFVVADYSAMELRLAAVEAQDAAMLTAFREQQDLHTNLARAIYGTETPTKEQRQIAKSANFALLYGGGAHALRSYAIGMGIEISEEEAERIRTTFKETYKGVAEWHRVCGFTAQQKRQGIGQWPNIRIRVSGMRRYLKDGNCRLTVAANTPVQGAGAAVMKRALHLLHRELGYKDDVQICAAIHDEIVMLAKEDRAKYYAKVLTRCMEEAEAMWLQPASGEGIAPAVEVGIGATWGSAK